MTTPPPPPPPPPGVDVEPMWRGRDFVRFGLIGGSAGAAVFLAVVLGIDYLVGDDGFDWSIGVDTWSSLGTWIGVAWAGVAVAWLPGSTRAARRMRAALFGTDDEVARLKARVLRGRPLHLTAGEREPGRYLARVTWSGSPGNVLAALAIVAAVVSMRIGDLLDPSANTIAAVSIAVLLALGVATLTHALVRRRNARRFIDETATPPDATTPDATTPGAGAAPAEE